MNIIRPEMLFWGGESPLRPMILVIGATIFGTVLKLRREQAKRFMQRELLLLVWFYVAIMASIAQSQYGSPDAERYAEEIFKLNIISFVLVALLDDQQRVISYQNVLLVFVVLLGIWGIEQSYRGNVRLEGLGGRAFGDSNGVAAVFVLFFPVALSKVIEPDGTGKRKVAGAISGFVTVLLIIFTKSRGGLLGLTAATAMMIARSKKKAKFAVIILLIAAIALPFMSEEYLERMSTMKSEETMDASGLSRLILWKAALKIFVDNPLFGTGLLSYPVAKMKYEGEFEYLDRGFKDWVFRADSPKVTHNTYLQVLSDTGLFGAVPYYLLIVGTFVSNFRTRRANPVKAQGSRTMNLLSAIESGILGYCVCIMFIDAVFTIFLPIQIVVSAIIRRIIRSEAEELRLNEKNGASLVCV